MTGAIMKRLIIVILCLIPFILNAQDNQGNRRGGNREDQQKQRIERLEKIRLIELLNLSEETVMKFFARRNDFYNKLRKFGGDKNKLIDNLEADLKSGKKFSNAYFQNGLKRILEMDIERAKQKQIFFKSLKDLLTTEQLAKYIVFETRFRDEMWNEMMKDDNRNKK
jgi:hypothetical protein